MCWARSKHGENRTAYSILVNNPEGKGLLGGHRLNQKNNTKTELKEIRCKDEESIALAQDRYQWLVVFVNTVVNIRLS